MTGAAGASRVPTAPRTGLAALPSRILNRWRSLMRRTTLRSKLVLAVVALVAVLGIVVSLVSALLLRSYLVGQLDEQLQMSMRRAEYTATLQTNQVGGVTVGQLLTAVVTRAVSPGTVVAFVSGGGGQTASSYANPTDPGSGQRTLPPDAMRSIEAIRGGVNPVSVNLGTLGAYRVQTLRFGEYGTLVVGLPLKDVQGTTASLVLIMLLATLAGIAFAAGIGLIVIHVSLRPLERVADTATEVSRLPLDRGDAGIAVRVPEDDTDPRTEVGRLSAAFNQMLGHVAFALEARQASENKVRRFVADASHELRTPLASIRGYAELTRRAPEPLPESAVRSLGRIESEADRMTDLVEDLLLLARLDEGRELDRDPVDLSRLVIDAVSDAHAAGRGHIWNVDLPPEPVTVIGDEKRLHQVLANLLTNARVHTPEGTVVDTVLRIDGAQAVVAVTDNGPGIPPELQAVLFERFARGDPSRARHTGSTGLGLAIVRAVVQAQGGDVTVQSVPGATTFKLVLPLGESAVPAEEEVELDPADVEGYEASVPEPGEDRGAVQD